MPAIPEPGFLKNLPFAMSEKLGVPVNFAAESILHAIVSCDAGTCGLAAAIISPFTESEYGLTAVEIQDALTKTSTTALLQVKAAIEAGEPSIDMVEAMNASGDAAEAELIVIAQSRARANDES